MKSDQIIEKIRHKLQDSDPSNRSVVNVFQFNFTDANGELIKSVDLSIYEGIADAPDGEVTVTDDDFFLVGTKRATLDDLIAKNKAVVKGDTVAVNKIMDKFRLYTEK